MHRLFLFYIAFFSIFHKCSVAFYSWSISIYIGIDKSFLMIYSIVNVSFIIKWRMSFPFITKDYSFWFYFDFNSTKFKNPTGPVHVVYNFLSPQYIIFFSIIIDYFHFLNKVAMSKSTAVVLIFSLEQSFIDLNWITNNFYNFFPSNFDHLSNLYTVTSRHFSRIINAK